MKALDTHTIRSICTAATCTLFLASAAFAHPPIDRPNCGTLDVIGLKGQSTGLCPLQHTDVRAEISGMVARVTVTQRFANPYAHKIEAVYTFPLSQNAAVDDMTMTIGERVIRGQIKERSEAHRIYQAAKQAGRVAALLDQERPNIFTQHVANIEPGKQIEVRISYVETLDWQDGIYSFDFPTVVGPRYVPGAATARTGTGWSPDTDQVPDASRITPPVTPPGTRSGHDITIAVRINAGRSITGIESPQHDVAIDYLDDQRNSASITLRNQAEIPNRDFVLKYRTASNDITDSLLTHTDQRGRFFTLVLQPPKRVPPQWIVPRELIFVIDKSGSMNGFPINTAKQTMQRCIENLNPNDTFNLMTFAGGVGFCFPNPVPNSQENRRRAIEYLRNLQGSGGTEMMKAIYACLGGERDPDPERVRIVCFMTDGYVGNDQAIIAAVQKNADTTRVFSFGIGSSVNRFLLDGMARAGRGEVEYVLSPDQASQASMRFYERINAPVLTDVQLDWSAIDVQQVYPQRIPDLFSAKPVIVMGRYTSAGRARVTLRGRRGQSEFSRTIDLDFPHDQPANESLASLWARARVDDLMSRDLAGLQRGAPDPGLKERVVQLALKYRLLTQFTSFVAIDQTTTTRDGQSITVTVPVEMPQGVSYEGVFGIRGERARITCRMAAPAPAATFNGRGQAMYDAVRRVRPGNLHKNSFNTLEFDRSGLPENLGELDSASSLTEDQRKDRKLLSKLAPDLIGLERRLDPDGNYNAERVRVHNRRVEVAVRLTEMSDDVVSRLQALGFKVLFRGRADKGLIIGTIAIDKLNALALLDCVQFVEPTNWSQMD